MNFSSKRAALATRHGKERIFAPAFASIGVDVVVADVDTDIFGTFAGEVERIGSATETVERKARAAATSTALPIGLASEGSIGPHPFTPYVLMDTELVAWVDVRSEHLLIERATAISLVPPTEHVTDESDVDELPIVTGFPDQAAIVVVESTETVDRRVVAKAITSADDLRRAIDRARSEIDAPVSDRVLVEPDLRAHLCPDRRTVIAAAVERLVARLKVPCPNCGAPGFGPIATIPGLRCGLCDLPTTMPAGDRLGCRRCGHEDTAPRSGVADPTHCDRCNP